MRSESVSKWEIGCNNVEKTTAVDICIQTEIVNTAEKVTSTIQLENMCAPNINTVDKATSTVEQLGIQLCVANIKASFSRKVHITETSKLTYLYWKHPHSLLKFSKSSNKYNFTHSNLQQNLQPKPQQNPQPKSQNKTCQDADSDDISEAYADLFKSTKVCDISA